MCYQGYFRVDRLRLRHRQHAGGHGAVLDREVFERGQVCAVLPIDPRRDQVVLIEQFRPGAYAAGWHPWLIECVAGVIEPGETPESVARREALEEAGCVIDTLELVSRYLSSPGATTETVHLYAGRADLTRVGGVHGLAHEGEDIRVDVVSVEAALALLDRGAIVNAKTVIALQWLRFGYPALKARWLRA